MEVTGTREIEVTALPYNPSFATNLYIPKFQSDDMTQPISSVVPEGSCWADVDV